AVTKLGGERHVGAYGIVYGEDQNVQGIASDYGTRYSFPNAPINDRKLYETERYNIGDLIYTFDISNNGAYVIIMKFSEVYFDLPGQKVFDIYVNNVLVKANVDIFMEANAAGIAYDLYIDFMVKNDELVIGDMIGNMDGRLQIRLSPKVDNPKINAIAVLVGSSDSLPSPPPPVPQVAPKQSRSLHDDYDDVVDDVNPYEDIGHSSEHEFASGPPASNPFDHKNDNVFMILGVVLVCLLPVIAFLMHM
ncbi:hypothetical protein DICVIV_04699, partial [Dictyocaulus viviparus]